MNKKELAEARTAVKKVKAEVLMRGMPYARVRDLDSAIAVIETMMLNGKPDE